MYNFISCVVICRLIYSVNSMRGNKYICNICSINLDIINVRELMMK